MTLAREEPRRRFERIARLPDHEIDLAEAALIIAEEEYPGLPISTYLDRLDDLARRVAPRLERASGLRVRVERLDQFLFGEEGFSGDRENYYDPRNSFLNEVLDRRSGIPISLSLVYTEVAHRLGLDARGVSFPGHFLLKVVDGEEIVVDAFFGTILSEEACRERLEQAVGAEVPFDPAVHLRPATQGEILVRLLSNLKQIHLRTRDFSRALACCDRILLLTPGAPVEVRDRGAVYEQLECFGAALADLEHFLALAPDDPSAAVVEAKVSFLRTRAPRVH